MDSTSINLEGSLKLDDDILAQTTNVYIPVKGLDASQALLVRDFGVNTQDVDWESLRPDRPMNSLAGHYLGLKLYVLGKRLHHRDPVTFLHRREVLSPNTKLTNYFDNAALDGIHLLQWPLRDFVCTHVT